MMHPDWYEALMDAILPVEEGYDITFTVYGMVKGTKANGATTVAPRSPIPELTDIRGRVYQKARAGTTAVREGQNPNINYETKLMCNPKLDIPTGCRIVVTDIHNNTLEYRRVDEGFGNYVTHQEITLIRQEDVN